jgi:tRNA dimethylallyltransferase
MEMGRSRRTQFHTWPIPAIVGPTAVGKTAVAVALAEARGWEVISADSRQVYRGLDIGTAKPTPPELSRVRHHLIDVVDAWQSYSCGRYRREALAAVADVVRRGPLPLVVGGSGLYLRALNRGLFEGPERDESIRGKLKKLAETEGRERLHDMLARVDPAAASRIHPRNTERVIRAIEVFELTGRPISELQKEHKTPNPITLVAVGLRRSRELLYDQIGRRFDAMLERGLVEEVRTLVQRGFSEDWPSFRSVGYREMVGYLRGELSLDASVERAKTQTRRFAKRQLTWFSKAPIHAWLDVPEGETARATAERVVAVFREAGVPQAATRTRRTH